MTNPSLAALGLLLLAPRPALANGQVSHLWVSQTAIELLPPGELKDLLSDPAHEDMWRNGSMFPDGGYAVGDGYGETAHWEPFHNATIAWIRDTYGGPPYSGEAAEYVAFLMGMTSHGMADQVYDSLYMQRAHQEDAAMDWSESMDEATDVAFASYVGPVDHGELWVPDELMAQLMGEAMGHEVSASTIRTGQAMVRLVPVWVAEVIQQPEYLEPYLAQFPWACSHQIDPLVWGNPPDEAEVVARYWQEIWGRLSGEELPVGPVLATFPPDGKLGWETDFERVTARVTTISAWSLRGDLVPELDLQLTTDDGEQAAISRWVYYANVIHAEPTADLAPTTHYTVTVPADLPFSDAAAPTTSDPYEYGFTTGPVPLAGACAAVPHHRGSLAWLALLGLAALARRHPATPRLPGETP
jgi:hypothetical protein